MKKATLTMQAPPKLLKSTPDLSLEANTEKMSNRGNWRSRSAHVAPHKSVSSRPRPTTPVDERYGKHHAVPSSTMDSSALPPKQSSPVRRPCSLSPHHNRSLSSRSMKRPTPQQMQREAQEEEFRSRGSTMPFDSASYYLARRKIRSRIDKKNDHNGSSVTPPIHEPGDEEDDEYYLLRTFSITSKGGIVSEGDCIKQRSRSNNSVASTTSTDCHATSTTSLATSFSSGEPGKGPSWQVLILGSMGVGKTALITQFMTSEYMNEYDTQDEDMEKCVSILLDGTEYELVFVDNLLPSATLESNVSSAIAEAYVVVYSVTERKSFEKAVDILFGLREGGITASKAVILVGNKSDLARTKEVAIEEGKAIASSYECKFIETSACINHNVDQLLVGIVSQIRLKSSQSQERKELPSNPVSPFRKWGSTKASLRSSLKARGIFNRILGKGPKRSKSCENLHVL